MRSYGYVKGPLYDNEVIIKAGKFPSRYELKNLPAVRDQGATPKCVSVSLTDMVNWRLKYYNKVLNDDAYFFNRRADKSIQGMIPREAMIMTKRDMYDSGLDWSANLYTRLASIEMIKYSIVTYGPVMSCFIVRSSGDRFWLGSGNYGGHAVLLVAYDSYGFTIRNSWGSSYASGGYIDIPYEECNRITEAWALIN